MDTMDTWTPEEKQKLQQTQGGGELFEAFALQTDRLGKFPRTQVLGGGGYSAAPIKEKKCKTCAHEKRPERSVYKLKALNISLPPP
jgi:hypothetical protein